ncbi:hypothetical protein Rvan_1490 [Rhodomicrobium vannielii ATCC 17100]|uniref:Uncharacterized protein n=1 Tax=Rhodomicrobium vannielii (strain ATCC 17100 / DSM 162 / LMG 4299 / NCIMB 10020 / ATH 3.1.1) TaxID=648757 RepID=E3I794_RHOVT|nr:hypothetical protein [Rhodomicrobium vannielii]ADP70745.1 hypothetical protein Rvan_1490 [Rhodomicrobium vannielii ATCC 17100]
MTNTDENLHILPRPVERLPDYAHAKARQTLAERLTNAFDLSGASAIAISNSVVDPSEVRASIGGAEQPDVERIPVPGGTLLGIRTSVWARRVMPDPRNPRTFPARRHPFAIEPGTGGEDSKFRPIPEPRPLDAARPQVAELAVMIENRHHLIWASQHAERFVLEENNWKPSIESQGVMEAVWLVATTYEHADGSAPATVLTTVEGSSRTTAVHSLLEVHSHEVPYDDQDAKLRAYIRRLNELFDKGERDRATTVALRCERIPALILVGFRPYPGGSTTFPTAVRSFVALRHVDPPKPWGPGPENESLADEVLDEFCRRNLISETERDYYAGSCTKAEAKAAHLPVDPVLRAAHIVRLFTSDDSAIKHAMRVAVTSQSSRKNIGSKLKNELATGLILRAVADEPAKVDQIRRYLRHAFGQAVHKVAWTSTGRTTEQIVKESLAEVRAVIGDGSTEEPGPASMELAVRAAYPLVVDGRLNADRGTSNNEQPDRRTPGEILDTMRRSIQGVHQLGRALRDYEEGVPLRAVDEEGEIKRTADDSADQIVSDIYLRNEFPPAGKMKARRPGDTPTDRYYNSLSALGSAMMDVKRTFDDLKEVRGDDNQPIVEVQGVELRHITSWRDLLSIWDEEMVVWGRTFRKKYGTKDHGGAIPREDDEPTEVDPYAEAEYETADN